MQHWFETGAGDGFMMVDGRPGDMATSSTLLVPELQKRGLFRTAYEGTTPTRRAGPGAPGEPALSGRKCAALAFERASK
jgi:alkanesulfonate monooxygenase